MAGNQHSKWKLQDLSDAEISAAIQYLDPAARMAPDRAGFSAVFVVCIWLLVLLLVGLGMVWLSHRILG